MGGDLRQFYRDLGRQPGTEKLSDQEQDSGSHPFHREPSGIIFDPPKNSDEEARQRREWEQHEFARSQVKTNNRLAWFTGALVVATVCTIGIGIWQAVISRNAAGAAIDAASTAKDALQSETRPWIGVDGVPQFVTGSQSELELTLRNYGRSPAVVATPHHS